MDYLDKIIERAERGELRRVPKTIAKQLVEFRGKNVSEEELTKIANRLHYEPSVFIEYYRKFACRL